MNLLKPTLIAAAMLAALTATARGDYEKVDVYENLEVGQTVEFEGQDHRSTPCVYYSVEPEDWDTYSEFIELNEKMVYDNPDNMAQGLCGGDGGIRHFTLTALKNGTIVVNEYRNDCERAILTVHHYTIGKATKSDNTLVKTTKSDNSNGKKIIKRKKVKKNRRR